MVITCEEIGYFRGKIEILGKNQMKIIKLKNKISEIKSKQCMDIN